MKTFWRNIHPQIQNELTLPIFLAALCDPTYARQQMERERGDGLGDEVSTEANDNSKLRQLGRGIIDNYVKAYLRTHFPNLPEGRLLNTDGSFLP